jgi:hypothetical protein
MPATSDANGASRQNIQDPRQLRRQKSARSIPEGRKRTYPSIPDRETSSALVFPASRPVKKTVSIRLMEHLPRLVPSRCAELRPADQNRASPAPGLPLTCCTDTRGSRAADHERVAIRRAIELQRPFDALRLETVPKRRHGIGRQTIAELSPSMPQTNGSHSVSPAPLQEGRCCPSIASRRPGRAQLPVRMEPGATIPSFRPKRQGALTTPLLSASRDRSPVAGAQLDRPHAGRSFAPFVAEMRVTSLRVSRGPRFALEKSPYSPYRSPTGKLIRLFLPPFSIPRRADTRMEPMPKAESPSSPHKGSGP